MPNFEVFDKRAIPMTKRPQVTIQARGTLSFNASSYHVLGEPKALELLFDREAQIIGFRPADTGSPNAYPIRPVSAGGTYVASGGAFLKYYGVDFSTPMRYDADFTDGLLMVDLKKGGRVATSNRNRAAMNAASGGLSLFNSGAGDRLDEVLQGSQPSGD